MQKKITSLKFTNRFYQHLNFLFANVKVQALREPTIVHINEPMLLSLGLSSEIINSSSFLRFINGDLEFEGTIYGASVYAGHQFGHFVHQLGDGRAVMIGEVETQDGHFFELQLKGSGLTPFSRRGDGKAVFRSSVREYLASAHLKALGVPTTEALSLIRGSADVYREEVEKEAMVLRVAESFIRFGHFEFLYHHKYEAELKTLIDFTIENYFSEYKDHPNKYVLFFQEVVKKTAKLFAKWQSIGFCHGVLNTDNMSILGLTLDYGPYGFIDNFNQDYICNHSDHEGRYSLGNQPGIGMWNLEKLKVCLSAFMEEEAGQRTIETYPPIFLYEYRRLLLNKCGLYKVEMDDEEFLKALLNMLVVTEVDYTVFFRALSRYTAGSRTLGHLDHPQLIAWLLQYDERLKKEELVESTRHEQMLKTNPKFILRNYVAQMCIEDSTLIPKAFEILSNPFDEWMDFDDWKNPAPSKYKDLCVSCSS